MSRCEPWFSTNRFGHAARLVAVAVISNLCLAVNAQVFTNLQQIKAALTNSPQAIGDVDIVITVCAASRPRCGVLIVQDESGVELLQVGDFSLDIQPGERLRIHHDSCLIRKRESGIQLSALPFVSNDGMHAWAEKTNEMTLRAGKIPVRVEWFNYWHNLSLDVLIGKSDEPLNPISSTNLWRTETNESGSIKMVPGLFAECFEGLWESVPDFNLLPRAKSGGVTNFDLGFRSRDERVGIRFSGFIEIPVDGNYRFVLGSDDGSLLFLGNPNVAITRLGHATPPPAIPCELPGQRFNTLDERRWITVEGRVGFVARTGDGVKFDLGTDRHKIAVTIHDAAGIDLIGLRNSKIKIAGIGRGVMSVNQSLDFGKLFAASPADIIIVEPSSATGARKLPLTSVAEVQGLPIEEARKELPVRIRGTVTGANNTSQQRWMSFQDETRGIFARLMGVTNATPVAGELWQLEGVSAAGDFAPIVVAKQMTYLGEGLLPTPITPTWPELLNGTLDVQWVELNGLMTDVRGNVVSLHLPEGRLDVELEGSFESELRQFLKSVVRIRGVLYAVWDAATREVRVGRVMMRNAAISVDVPAPGNPFDAVSRTPRELLLFDAQASAFRPVKVRGQITYADSTRIFLQADDAGLQLLPLRKFESKPGDLVEAVGYSDLTQTEIVLRETILKRTGQAPLPTPNNLTDASLSFSNLNSTRVRVEGKLLGWRTEKSGPVLEMQSGVRLFLARIASEKNIALAFPTGSRLALEGIYVGRRQGQNPDADNESFELLMNSLADVSVLSRPSWWTLPRLLVVLTMLLVILIVTVIWNTQLRRIVEQRTHQLQNEIRERERFERHAALETERSRIARDLHDDLGSSLTEISVLASTGQLPQPGATSHSGLFQSISTRARSLIAALDVIVWAVDPEDNSLQSLADYLTGYTNDYFSHTQIACRFKVPVSFPPITLEGRVRHDLLMAVKEALNNIVRHAQATELEFRLDVVDNTLEIDIADNGKGIETGAHSAGHGLKNLSTRLNKLGGQCTIEPRNSGGTIVKIRLPLAASGVVSS